MFVLADAAMVAIVVVLVASTRRAWAADDWDRFAIARVAVAITYVGLVFAANATTTDISIGIVTLAVVPLALVFVAFPRTAVGSTVGAALLLASVVLMWSYAAGAEHGDDAAFAPLTGWVLGALGIIIGLATELAIGRRARKG